MASHDNSKRKAEGEAKGTHEGEKVARTEGKQLTSIIEFINLISYFFPATDVIGKQTHLTPAHEAGGATRAHTAAPAAGAPASAADEKSSESASTSRKEHAHEHGADAILEKVN